jgi:hypothetical protein
VDVVVLAFAILVIASLGAVALLARRVGRLERRLTSLTRDDKGRSLEAILEAHLDKVMAVGRGLEDLTGRTAILEAAGRRAFQRVGLVRYNPFEETGGNQSFALALIDAEDDGFIISSLHARAGTRIYAKPLTAGRSEGALSEEEVEALALARGASKGRPAIADHTGGSSRGA